VIDQRCRYDGRRESRDPSRPRLDLYQLVSRASPGTALIGSLRVTGIDRAPLASQKRQFRKPYRFVPRHSVRSLSSARTERAGVRGQTSVPVGLPERRPVCIILYRAPHLANILTSVHRRFLYHCVSFRRFVPIAYRFASSKRLRSNPAQRPENADCGRLIGSFRTRMRSRTIGRREVTNSCINLYHCRP
jgi:hypothetical protein